MAPSRSVIPATTWLVLASCLFAAWLTGQLLRDRFLVRALCFYLPSPLVTLVLVAIALGAWRKQWGRLACLISLLAVAPLGVVGLIENKWVAPSVDARPGSALRLVHWNVFGGTGGWDRVCRMLKAQRADIYVLSEVPGDASLDALAAELGKGYVALGRGNLAVLARGGLRGGELQGLDGAKWFSVVWEAEGTPLSLLVADLPSNPRIARPPLLAKVWDATRQTRPDLVVGDFNTPRRSRALTTLPEGYAHAYDLAGAGWSYTWPAPVPLWAIDQCLLGPHVQAVHYDLQSTTISDHRLQVLDFRRTEQDGLEVIQPAPR